MVDAKPSYSKPFPHSKSHPPTHPPYTPTSPLIRRNRRLRAMALSLFAVLLFLALGYTRHVPSLAERAEQLGRVLNPQGIWSGSGTSGGGEKFDTSKPEGPEPALGGDEYPDPVPEKGKLTTPRVAKPRVKVPLEVHIMSKCPDAQYCIQKLILPSMSQILPKTHFMLNYIGTVSPSSGQISCMHGPEECLSNAYALCAVHQHPQTTRHLPFVGCLEAEFRSLPNLDVVAACARRYLGSAPGLVEELSSCARGEVGERLLRESVLRSQSVGATVSCTVRVDERVWCIRDGDEWRDCEGGYRVGDLVRVVEKLYREKNEL